MGLAPDGGDVVIERKKNGNWETVSHANAGGNRVFAKKFRLKGKAKFAREGGWRNKPSASGRMSSRQCQEIGGGISLRASFERRGTR